MKVMPEDGEDTDQPKRRSPRARLLVATAIVLLALPCLGLVGSVSYFSARKAGVFSRWRSLGMPPGGGVGIVTGDISVVYVRTGAGAVFGCSDHRGRKLPDDCWREGREPYGIDRKAAFDSRVYEGEAKPPPGTVVDSLEVSIRYGDAAFETRYVLLEDGTLWKWEYDVSAYGDLGTIVLGPLAGMALGIVAVIVIWARAGIRGLAGRTRR